MLDNNKLKNFFSGILASRTRVMIVLMIVFAMILGCRLFYLQVIEGKQYQENYNLTAERTETIDATRGNIYDRNGNLLAYNELTYAVTIEDTGTYTDTDEKNKKLNAEISSIIENLEANGDAIDNDFGISLNDAGEYEFIHEGTSLQRFRADIFGHSSINDLKYNDRYDIDEANATADEIMEYLISDRFDISKDYDKAMQYKIAIVRYNMSLNTFQRYISTTIASDVSDETVAYIRENQNTLTGVDVEQKSVRRYVDSEYYSHIIGYIGPISTDEYEELKDTGDYDTTDVIGKAGIEQYMDSYLRGTKGSETVYVDNVGNPLQIIDHKDAVSGNDVYLSIDKDLQAAVYNLLEQKIAGIVYSKIQNIREFHATENTEGSDIPIPIYDVYFALIDNNLIDTDHFSAEDATDTERYMLQAFENRKASAIAGIQDELTAASPSVYSDLTEEYQAYCTRIATMLREQGVINSDAIDRTDEVYQAWTSESLSLKDYLTHAIEQDWVDITLFAQDQKYVDTDELYSALVTYILEQLQTDSGFEKLVYQYLILQDQITGNQLCLVLYEQGILPWDESAYQSLRSGGMSAFNFLREKIRTLEITPAQLGLEPSSGSCVMIDTNTGELLACVTYPGYDTNRLANTMDSDYYSYLNQNLSNPLYNHATQQRTAPGSTFKMVTATAGLAEGVITTTSTIQARGIYENVSNHPRCWIYPRTHGVINVSQAIRDSCDYFFYEVGFRLAGSGNYSDAAGIEKIQKYAAMYGLTEKTGIELVENTSQIATEYPVMAAIGQSDNNLTTIGLARYVTAVANSGTVYNLSLLNKVTDKDGNVLETFGSSVKNQIDVLDASEWNAIHSGMRMVVENSSAFRNFSVNVAGKTGTAEIGGHPNHALFVGYAPYENPQIALATRITYGYTSSNAAALSRDILDYYFNGSGNILNGQASEVAGGNDVSD